MKSFDLSLADVPRTKNGLIKPQGVMFYYLHRADRSICGCVCFGAFVGKKPLWVRFCRGISFCSKKDRFSKAIARELAYRRFLLAVIRKENSEPIRRPGIDSLMMSRPNLWRRNNLYKSCFGITLTGEETMFWKRNIPQTGAKRRSTPRK